MLGDGIATIAVVWQTLELTSGAGALALVLVVHSGSHVAFTLGGGVLTDRFSGGTSS